MKVAAFIGSPRKNGNTELLLREAVRGVEESGASVEVFNLNKMEIMPCQGCEGCNDTAQCIYHDEMDQIYDAIKDADRIIVSSPIFFFSISAQLKAMIDRCQSFWCGKYLLNQPLKSGEAGRKGLLILVGGMTKKVGAECSEACVRAFFRTVNIPEHETLHYLGVDHKGDIVKHETAMKDAYEAGKRLGS